MTIMPDILDLMHAKIMLFKAIGHYKRNSLTNAKAQHINTFEQMTR